MKRYSIAAILAALAAGVLAASAFAAAPANTTPPQVSGTAQVGKSVSVSNGEWTGSPTSYAYQWQRCTGATCTNIAGATTQSYVVRSADAGHTLRATVKATNADGSSTANSNETATVSAGPGPQNTTRPVILGDAYVGELLTASNGRWNPTPDSFAYQWLQCNAAGLACVNIPGATTDRYRVRLADLDSTLRVDVTAKASNGDSTTVRSTHSDVVQLFVPEPVAGNAAPRLTFISLKRLGNRLYARFRVCDDSGRISVVERDSKTGQLGYVRKYAVNTTSCVNATRSWTPAPRFRHGGAMRVSLRAVDKSGKASRQISRSFAWR